MSAARDQLLFAPGMPQWEIRTGEACGDANIVARRHGACLKIVDHCHEHPIPPGSRPRPDVEQAPTKPATPDGSGCGNIFAPRALSFRWARTRARGACAERNASAHRCHMVRLRPPAGRIPGAKCRAGCRRRSERARASPRSADRAAVVSGSVAERRRWRDRRRGRIASRPLAFSTGSSANAAHRHGNRVRPTTWRRVRLGRIWPVPPPLQRRSPTPSPPAARRWAGSKPEGGAKPPPTQQGATCWPGGTSLCGRGGTAGDTILRCN
jgi:hypothetical protein